MKFTKCSIAIACALSTFCAAVPVVHASEISLSELNELSEVSELRIEPVMTVRHSDDSAESLYRVGRHHQQANRLEEAASAYRAALQKEAGHIEARNALATIYFAQKNLGAAMAEFKTILQQQPGLSHVHSNLGYAYMLEENYPAAMPALAQAIVIDPSNTRAFGNLTLAYERLSAMVKEGSTRPVAVKEAEAKAATDATPAATANVVETPQVKAATAQQESIAAEPERGVAVVIANGTRDDAVADRIADGLRKNGVNVGQVTDLAPYKQQRTVILYRDGYRKEALELSRMFAVPPAVVNNTRTRDADDRSTVRLVLGKTSAQADIRSAATQLAAR